MLVACISPSSHHLEETINTLKYANRAKNIKTTVTRNVLNVKHHITEYVAMIGPADRQYCTCGARWVSARDRAQHGS